MTKLQAIQKEIIVLPEEDRAALVTVLLSTLGGPSYDVSDEEVARRDEEMEAGTETGISHAEFVTGLRPKNGR